MELKSLKQDTVVMVMVVMQQTTIVFPLKTQTFDMFTSQIQHNQGGSDMQQMGGSGEKIESVTDKEVNILSASQVTRI